MNDYIIQHGHIVTSRLSVGIVNPPLELRIPATVRNEHFLPKQRCEQVHMVQRYLRSTVTL